jgi:hypothetical protein
MAEWRRHRTTVDSIVGQLLGISLVNAASITGEVKECSSGTVVSIPGAVVDAPNSIARLDVGPWLASANLGPWELTWHPVFGDGSKPIWPEQPATDTIIVLA